jgi:uncharacterized protein involved in exopolysaccharide biosynthesis
MYNDIKEVNLIEYAYVLIKRRKIIFWFTGIIILISFILMFFILPRWYKSKTVIIPPKQKAQFSISSVLRNMVPFGGFGVGRGSDELYNYIAIINSRTCLEDVVDRFDLKRRYKEKDVTDAIKELQANITVDLSTDEVALEIIAYDTDSLMAANIANYLVEVLNKIYLNLMVQEAKSNREFLEQRYNQNLTDLKKAEENLRDFQKRFAVYALPEQIKAAVQAAAEIKSRVIAKEIEIGILRKTVAEDDPSVYQTKLELLELNKKLGELKYGNTSKQENHEVFSPFQKTPELGMQYIRHFRDVEIQQKLAEILFPLYEQAKIEEHRDTPTILILDKAVPAHKPAKPRRVLIILLVAISSFIISIFLVFFIDFLFRVNVDLRENQNNKLNYIASQLEWRRFFFLDKKLKN